MKTLDEQILDAIMEHVRKYPYDIWQEDGIYGKIFAVVGKGDGVHDVVFSKKGSWTEFGDGGRGRYTHFTPARVEVDKEVLSLPTEIADIATQEVYNIYTETQQMRKTAKKQKLLEDLS